MRQWRSAAVLGAALASNWAGVAFGQTGCPASFEGATAKELSACITSIQNSITELKNKGAGILVVGQVDDTGSSAAISQQSGAIKATAKKTGTGTYEVSYTPPQPKPPIVLVGPRTNEPTSVAITNPNESGFTATIRENGGGVRSAGFWFAVIGP